VRKPWLMPAGGACSLTSLNGRPRASTAEEGGCNGSMLPMQPVKGWLARGWQEIEGVTTSTGNASYDRTFSKTCRRDQSSCGAKHAGPRASVCHLPVWRCLLNHWALVPPDDVLPQAIDGPALRTRMLVLPEGLTTWWMLAL
jgi:hypothetical protein